ncbi:MAG TPA: macro domain-containing protein [Candidatus Limnocylindrales bacterium]|nr:macro domain-containing protein [Candidatus Limnocylindrales bacterium]
MAELQLWHGDICDLEVDAIVAAASTALWMSSGVGAALKRRGGDGIEFDAVRQGPVPLGSAVVTSGGQLSCRYVIHAASLGMDRRTSAAAIDAATRAAMRQAARLAVETVAFPALGTGVGGFPLDEAAGLVVGAVRDELPGCPTIERVIFALRGGAAYVAFEGALKGQPVGRPA